MTRLEKALELNYNIDIIKDECPEAVLDIEPVPCPVIAYEASSKDITMCEFCWNQNYKEDKPL